MLFRNILNAIFLLLISLPLILLILMVERDPLLEPAPELSQREIEAVEDFLVDNDPRTLFDGEVQNVFLPEGVADSMLRYLAREARGFTEIRTESTFIADEAQISVSIPVNAWIFGDYVNIQIYIDEGALPARISKISIGGIEAPYWLIDFTVQNLLRLVDDQPEARTLVSLLSSIQEVAFTPGMARMIVQLDAVQMNVVSNTARDLMITPEQQNRVADYYQALVDTENRLVESGTTRVSLNVLFNDIFEIAYNNVLAGQDAANQNRAVFLALAVYLSDLSLEQVSSADFDETLRNHSPEITVYLNGREDLAAHLVTSAALASSSSRSTSRILSVYKEVSDSRTDSGFSFDDMIANTVGTALGEIATSTQSTAHRLQNILKDVANESEYMPQTMTNITYSEQEFTAEFGSRSSPAYQQRMLAIEQSISALPLFQGFSRDIEISLEP